ncbi:TetR/AcrR family transcriptional regulator [Nocardia sp. CNY236]|uniref:TetR/AcrR family transcriptional regulator n=1 Tax=Nocardia sp. CNY236 TaxID=1169152 RepID=UPI000400F3EF|nr:TetR/AcrR family transcriptional regulator [Nocardia sp. CNY236]
MPRLADHEQRRHQITNAARRVIASGGLEAATFQSVAAEAGVSVRLVQYYFGTKREFLLATHRAVMVRAATRFARELAALGESATPRDILRTLFTELLPLDDARRDDSIVLGAFHHATLTGAEIGAADTLGAPRFVVDTTAEQLRRLRIAETPIAARALELDAQLIASTVGGLVQGFLVDCPATEDAAELLDRLLDRMLEP